MPTPFLIDSFVGSGVITGHLADTGQGWFNNLSGGILIYGCAPNSATDPTVSTNMLTVTAANTYGEACMTGAAPSPDYYVEADIHLVNGGSLAQRVAIGMRCAGTTSANFNGYFLEVDPNGGTSYLFNVLVGAVNIAAPSVSPGSADFTPRMQIDGFTITVSCNGTVVWSGVDPYSFSNVPGAPFVYVQGGAGGAADTYISQVRAEVLRAPPAAFWTDYVKTVEVDA